MGIRLERFNRLIQEEISELIREELPSDQYGWVSVTMVKTSPDLSEAHVFITVFPEHLEEKTLQKLNQMAGYIRKYLSRRVRAKTVPRLRFEIDNYTKLVERGVIDPSEGD